MFNLHTKFEMSTITCNEETKDNAKCKNSRSETLFGGPRCNAQGSSMARWTAHYITLHAEIYSARSYEKKIDRACIT